jgi:hypothetical protein
MQWRSPLPVDIHHREQVRMLLWDATGLIRRAPLSVDACRSGGPIALVTLIAMELDDIVVPSVPRIWTVFVFALDTHQHDLPILNPSWIWTEYCRSKFS